jgi:hypothetical protein
LVAYALRTTLRQALIGQTLAEDRIFDSLVASIPSLAGDGVLPLIIVSSDDDEAKLRHLNARLEPEERQQTVLIEIALASSVTVEAGTASVEIPHTDEGLEMILDLMRHRVWRVLRDPANPWADLFRSFLGEPKRYFTRRGADDTEGVLFAARQIGIVCDPMPEPVLGQPIGPGTPWGDLLAGMAETDSLAAYADLIRAELETPELPAWQILQARLGLERAAAAALGYGAVPGGEAEPDVSRLTVKTALRDIVVEGDPGPSP